MCLTLKLHSGRELNQRGMASTRVKREEGWEGGGLKREREGL
jgi:hypothetical protein